LPRAAWTHAAHLAEVANHLPLYEAVNRLLLFPQGNRDLSLRFDSKDQAFLEKLMKAFVQHLS
jgi:hypothetical protein